MSNPEWVHPPNQLPSNILIQGVELDPAAIVSGDTNSPCTAVSGLAGACMGRPLSNMQKGKHFIESQAAGIGFLFCQHNVIMQLSITRPTPPITGWGGGMFHSPPLRDGVGECPTPPITGWGGGMFHSWIPPLRDGVGECSTPPITGWGGGMPHSPHYRMGWGNVPLPPLRDGVGECPTSPITGWGEGMSLFCWKFMPGL